MSRRLSELEGVIERGLGTFIEVGEALLEIRDSRLYRETYGTFEDYCQERWGLKRGRAYELMGASKVAGLVSEISDTPPTRESHAAELAPLREEPEQMAEAMTAATERAETEGRPVTAQDVREAVEPRHLALVGTQPKKVEYESCPTCGQRVRADRPLRGKAVHLVAKEFKLKRAIADARTMMNDDAVRRVFESELQPKGRR